MNVHYCVSGRVESDDSQLLDAIEAELPSPDEVRLGNGFRQTREPVEDGSGEVLSARMTFERGLQGQAAAEYLYDRVTKHILADTLDYSLELYRSPEGGVTVSDVREWYESHPDEQPTREAPDGSEEPYVPNRWNPNNHVLMEENDGSN